MFTLNLLHLQYYFISGASLDAPPAYELGNIQKVKTEESLADRDSWRIES